MNTRSFPAFPAVSGRTFSGGWPLEARRAMSLRPCVPSRLRITQGRAWITLGQAPRGAGNASGDLVLTAGESVWVPAGARVVMEPWQSGAEPLRFDWCAEPEARSREQAERFGREVVTPSRELGVALGQAGFALARLVRGLLGCSVSATS